MDDCNKLAPTKVVNHNQFWSTYMDNNTLINIKLPAIALTILFFIMSLRGTKQSRPLF